MITFFPRKKSQRAQSVVEFAFVLPFLVVFLLAIAEFFMIISTKILLNEAVSNGCRYISLNGIYNDHSLDEEVKQMIKNYSPNGLNPNDFSKIDIIFFKDSSGLEMVKVRADYVYKLVFPLYQIFSLLPGTSNSQLFKTGSFNMSSEFTYPMIQRGTVVCPSCGRKNPAGSQYCEYCGAKLN